MDANTTKRVASEHEDADLEAHDDDFEDEHEALSEGELEEFLIEAIEAFADESDEVARVDVATFRDCGVLTMNRGLVLQIGDSEFQITIVRSR